MRYEALTEGVVAGHLEYALNAGWIVLVHTYVEPGFAGAGIGSVLVRGALDDIRAKGKRRVVAQCPFVKAWLARHHEYDDLLDEPAEPG